MTIPTDRSIGRHAIPGGNGTFRARLLETIAQNILDLGDALIERCMAESGLTRAVAPSPT
jgi:hypothetical protein